MSKPKFLKPLIFGFVGISFVSLVTGLSINWSHTEYLQAVGSSGVKPFIEAFSTEYHKSHEKIDVVVEAGGTTFAIEQVAKGIAQIGNASNNPYWSIFKDDKETEYSAAWDSKKTLTLGWEAVGIMYKVPSKLSEQGKKDFEILITKDNLIDLYGVFSGFNENRDPGSEQIIPWGTEDAKEKNSMYHYLSKRCINKLSPQDIQIAKDTAIYPYLRSGGNTAANTSIAFTFYSNLVQFEELTPKQQNAFKGGQYGHDHPFGETDEANSKAWDLISTENIEGTMTYMSSGFFAPEGNRELMRQKGYKVANYLPYDVDDEENAQSLIEIDPSTGKYIFTPDQIAIKQTGYNWFRPINVMIDLNNLKARDYVWWIFFGTDDHAQTTLSDKYKQIMLSRGAQPLTDIQFSSMLASSGNLNESTYEMLFNENSTDKKLATTRPGSWSKVYGACEWGSE